LRRKREYSALPRDASIHMEEIGEQSLVEGHKTTEEVCIQYLGKRHAAAAADQN
ncbi:hypothetical protein CHS0354_022187, partial [Potamilus streckersoni]